MKNKQYYQTMLLDMVRPLIGHYSKESAHLNLGATAAAYGNQIAGMEGFSRVLWGLVPFWAGGGKEDRCLALYRQGLASGTDPDSIEFWGHLGDRDQRMVEMAAISFGILLVPDLLWTPLSAVQQDNLANWLGEINNHTQPDSNWQFFKVVTNLALKSVGRKWSQEQTEDAIARYETFYLGNGWYSDGQRPQIDYYTSFAIHYYCLIYARFMAAEDPHRSILYKERAKQFAGDFIHWFDDNGRALAFGRSQTYRFAQAAFWGMCLLAEVDCFSIGVLKGILTRHMEHWLNQPIFDNGHVLTVGYQYPNLMISEQYNASGSPYWAFKIFAFLALPDEHPFWSIQEEPLPPLNRHKPIKECRMIISRSNYDVSALVSGQYPVIEHPHAAEKYAKFAYSSCFGFSVPRSYYNLAETAPDSMLCFYVHGMYYVRRKCESYDLGDGCLSSVWFPTDGIRVETRLIPTEHGHLRRHHITSLLDCIAYDCGFAYPKNNGQIGLEERAKTAAAADRYGMSRISSDQGQGIIIHAAPNTNLAFPVTVIPAVCCEVKAGETMIESTIEAAFTGRPVRVGGDCYEVYDQQ